MTSIRFTTLTLLTMNLMQTMWLLISSGPFAFVFSRIGQQTDENSKESIIDSAKPIDGSELCDINQQKSAVNQSTPQLSIATANIDVHHQQQVNYPV